MKIAIVHPWFLEAGGGEKVAEALAKIYPSADIFALAVNPETLPPALTGRTIYVSGLNKILRGSFRFKRNFLMPLFAHAVDSFDLSRYDLVISSCGPAVMGVNTRPDAVHISYIHTPQRAWWDLYATRQNQLSFIVKHAFISAAKSMRDYEFSSMQRVDHVVSNSRYIASRVRKYYRRESTVIYPPVDTARGFLAPSHDDYYLTVSRLDIDKRIDLLIEACNRLGKRLKIVGTGRMEEHLRSIAGSTIEFFGRVPDSDLPDLYSHCRAFLFAADEDFGIVPVEAQSFGRPVVAYGHGGSLETVRVGDPNGLPDTGVFFNEQTCDSVASGIIRFESQEGQFTPARIQEHSWNFAEARFKEKICALVDSALENNSRGAIHELAS